MMPETIRPLPTNIFLYLLCPLSTEVQKVLLAWQIYCFANIYEYIYSNNFSDHYQSLLSLQACFMGMTPNHQEKQTDTDTDEKQILIKSSIRSFHFLHISEE